MSYFGKTPPTDAKFDHFAGEQYVKLHRIVDGDSTSKVTEEINEGTEQVMRELEEGLQRSFVDRCVDAQLETAWRLGVFYDLMIWESDIVRAKLLEEAMTKIQESKYVYIAQEGYQKGCLIIEMADFLGHSGGESEEHYIDKILIRSTGVPTYTAKDIAFQMWKFGLLQSDMKYLKRGIQPNAQELWTTHPNGERRSYPPTEAVINVIGFEQEYPQTAVRAALKIVGYERQYESSHHLSYGHVWLPEGRMSGRKGIGVSTDEVTDTTVTEAHRVVYEKHGSGLKESDMAYIAEAVGIGAVRFAMLRKNPDSQVTFNLSEIVNFSGFTSLYLQYVYVRASSILAKAKKDGEILDAGQESTNLEVLDARDEKALIFQLSLLPSVVRDALKQQNPSLVCRHGYDVAQAFSQFYKTSPVLSAPGDLRSARLQLVACTATVLRIVMGLLGIPVLERM